ncbi:MAG TPA: CcmD family protein [Ktedonobacteraceae bacterium]|nr:CcmD family protein [Ktedonobacteraceae bacterium]
MNGYVVAAYGIIWLGLFIYLAVISLRLRGVRTELLAVEELVRTQSDATKQNENELFNVEELQNGDK